MPELPEVEMYRRRFERTSLRQRIVRVEVTDPRILHRTTADVLARALEGNRFVGTRRHGKHLFAETNRGSWLYLHFGMTGDLHYGTEPPRFARLIVGFERKRMLAFEDMRLFGRVGLVADPDAFITSRRLGIDPLDAQFGFEAVDERFARRRGGIKAVLMNQSVIAGLGNLWVDEILFQSSVHPRAPIERLTRARRKTIFANMQRILKLAIERNEADKPMPRTYLIEHRTEDALCRRCGGSLRRATVAGRTTYFCKDHQRM